VDCGLDGVNVIEAVVLYVPAEIPKRFAQGAARNWSDSQSGFSVAI